ncbi:hypothetical protein [Streptomyces sp. NPDC089799]|uniref:hypothetical protein n=1 Tax=Streptomyces sp. NPDC089799 TaxID=3155066 RepID=UPI00342772FC
MGPSAPRWDPVTQRWTEPGDPAPPAPAPAPAPAEPPPGPEHAPPAADQGAWWNGPAASGDATTADTGWPVAGHAGQGGHAGHAGQAAPAAVPAAGLPLPPMPPLPPGYPPGPPGYPGAPQPLPPAPHDTRARSRLVPVTAGVAVAAVALGAAAVWFVQRDDPAPKPEVHGPVVPSGGPRSGSPQQETPAPSADAPSADPSGAPSGTATGIPSGPPSGAPSGTGAPTSGASGFPSPAPSDPAGAHRTVQDSDGFTIAVPQGWNREKTGSGVFYRAPDRTALLQVFRVSEADLSPLDAVRAASENLRSQPNTPDYTEISVGTVGGSSGAAELVYEYDSAESRGRRHGIERVFHAADGSKWAVLAAGPATAPDTVRQNLAAALAAFRPAP